MSETTDRSAFVCGKRRPVCDDCGSRMLHQTECPHCYGEDPEGYEWWCGDEYDDETCRQVCCGC